MPCYFIQKTYQGFQFSPFTSFHLTSLPLNWTFLFGCLSCTQQSVSSFFLSLFTILFLSHEIRNDSPLWYPHMIINKPFPLILLFICPSFWSLVSTHHIWPFEHYIRFTAKATPQSGCLTSFPLQSIYILHHMTHSKLPSLCICICLSLTIR